MKLVIFLAAIFISNIHIHAQMGIWTINLNGKKITTTSTEDEKVNCKYLKSSFWKKNGNLEIIFTENEADTWIRSFLFYDEDDNELKRVDSTTHTIIPVNELKLLFQGKKRLNIYTTIAPIDPSIAIRIRRVHLFTFMLP